jgi:serine/threonine protein kinase
MTDHERRAISVTSDRQNDDLTPRLDGSSRSAAVGDSFDRLLHQAAKVSTSGRVIAPGSRLSDGRFEILRRIGEGGMGVVYGAFDTTRKEKVALKTMSRMEARDVYQFKNEFRALCDVSHPNLVRLHELFTDGELWFFTMELVQGERFDHWVRPAAVGAGASRDLHEARLRDALSQLIHAVGAIHDAGKLHRDLKPSNVLVTQEGRVVVLDFGLAIDPEAGGVGQTVVDDNVSGTPAYMAPEQAGGRGAVAPSDYYAVGVMLFEALTGRLPFEGHSTAILADKQREAAPRAGTLATNVPAELDDVCARLLSLNPGDRPGAAELRALFPPSAPRSSRDSEDSSSRDSSRRSLSASTTGGSGASLAPNAAELIGRSDELATLEAAYEATLSGQAVVLFISGESGMGKSALCEAFFNQRRGERRATVLAGRCYERENVPFKGLDSLVDDLSRHLRKLPREEAIAVLPREVYALTRLFPALGRVEVVAEAPSKEVPDPLELRRRAYGAFGEMMTRMRDRAPLCVHLDDVQWLDADAVLFLRALLVNLDPPPGLLVLSHRSEGAEANAAIQSVRDAVENNSRLALRALVLGPLEQSAAEELARAQLARSSFEGGALESLPALIASECSGSPFFVGELCRFAVRHGLGKGGIEKPSLQAALEDNLNGHSTLARRLLELSALAGRPLPTELLLQAAQATHTELDQLRGSHLLRLSRVDGSKVVECYHDKVREAVTASLSELGRVGCFAALAGALEKSEHPDPEFLATCFEGAGQRERAAEHYAHAADDSLAGTAFLHAAALYEKALTLGSFAPERQHVLRVAQGDALAQAGRGKRAAELFLLAAKDVEGTESRHLRRRAAQELFETGHGELGVQLFRELFKEVGSSLPANAAAALPRLLYSQARLKLRGLAYVPRKSGAASAESTEALAVQRSAITGLIGQAHPLIAVSIGSEYLLRALTTAAPEHVANALGFWSYFLSVRRPNAPVTPMLETAFRIARELGDARLLATMEMLSGLCFVHQAQWKRARDAQARALDILQSNVRDAAFLLETARFFDQIAAHARGDWLDLARTTPNLIEQCFSRERLFGGVCLTGGGAAAWLSGDDHKGYQRALERAKSHRQRAEAFDHGDFYLLTGDVMLYLYRDQPEPGLDLLERNWARLSSFLGPLRMSLAYAWQMRGQAALAVLRKNGAASARTIVHRCLKGLSDKELPYLKAARSALQAGLALHTGDVEAAVTQLRIALAGYQENDLNMAAAAVRRRLGELIGGDEGRELLAQGDAVMLAQRVKNLDAVTEMLCPGCRAP